MLDYYQVNDNAIVCGIPGEKFMHSQLILSMQLHNAQVLIIMHWMGKNESSAVRKQTQLFLVLALSEEKCAP